MNKPKILVATVAAALLAAGAAVAVPLSNADEVRQALADAGHADVRDLERDGALWEAEVKGPDGRWYDLHVVAESGLVLDAGGGVPLLAEADISAQLEAAGYTDVRELELDGAVWEADAVDANGERMELRIAATDGSVLESERDDD